MSDQERITGQAQEEEVHIEPARPIECTERVPADAEEDAAVAAAAAAAAVEPDAEQSENAHGTGEEEVLFATESLPFGPERQEHSRLRSESAESTGFEATTPSTSRGPHCSHCEDSDKTETRDKRPFESTHSQTRIVHCLVKNSFHVVQDSRPVEMCPGCWESGLKFQHGQLIPNAQPYQVSTLNIPAGNGEREETWDSASPGSSQCPDFDRLRSSQPSISSSKQSSSPTPSSESTPSNVTMISETIHCKYEHFTETVHKTSAFKKDFNQVYGIASSPWTDDIYVVDSGNDRIVVLDQHGRGKLSFGGHGSGKGQFQNPHGIAISDRDEIIVADYWNDRVQIFDLSGHHKRTIKQFGDYSLHKPMSVAYIDGLIFVCDAKNILSFRYNGKPVKDYGSNIFNPWAIARGPNNTFVILDVPYHKLYKFTSDGIQKEYVNMDYEGLRHQLHHGVTVDREGYTLITRPVEERIDVFSPVGNILCCSLAGQNLGPVFGVAVLNDGRVAAACMNQVVIFQKPEPQWPSVTPAPVRDTSQANC